MSTVVPGFVPLPWKRLLYCRFALMVNANVFFSLVRNSLLISEEFWNALAPMSYLPPLPALPSIAVAFPDVFVSILGLGHVGKIAGFAGRSPRRCHRGRGSGATWFDWGGGAPSGDRG